MKKIVSLALAASFALSSGAAYANNPASQAFIPDWFRCGYFNFRTALGTGHWPMSCPDVNSWPF